MVDNIANNLEFYLGTVAGSIIHFSTQNKQDRNVHLRNDEKCEITALSWGRTNNEILIGYKNGIVQMYDIQSKKSIDKISIEKSPIVGVIPNDDDIFIALKSGNIYKYSDKQIETFLKNDDSDKSVEKFVLNKENPTVCALGGINYDIKVYDLITEKNIFHGKSDRHDELNLAQPISINSITFLNSTNIGLDIGTVTKQGQIRIYDTRAQRRAIKIYKNPGSVYTCISDTYREYEIAVGSSKGYLQVMDLRKEIKPLKTFKGYMGGLTDIICDVEAPLIASSSLDRHFRIHNLDDKKLEYEEYMKIQMSYILMRKKNFISPNDDDDDIEDIVEDIFDEDSDEENCVITSNKKRRKVRQGNNLEKQAKET